MPSQEVNKITEQIIGSAFNVSNTLGSGFVEKVYENALIHELRKSSLNAQQQVPLQVIYDEIVVGNFVADIIVEEKVLIELKAVAMFENIHTAQALNYLRSTGMDICLLLNFGTPKIQIKRLLPHVNWKSHSS